MAPRTRYFLIGSGLVVVVGLCSGLVAYYSGALPTRSARMAELAYLPADATMVGYANVSDIMASDFRQHLSQILPRGEEKTRFQEETGIDIERDIDAVFMAATPQTGSGRSAGVVVVRGRFDTAKIESVATGHGGMAETYGDVRMLLSPTGTGSTSESGIAFLEPNLLALGNREDLRRAIDARNGPSAATDVDLAQAIADIDRIGNAWLVARTMSLAEHPALPEVFRQRFDDVRWVSIGADVQGSMRALVRAEARDEQAALDLRAVVNGAIAAARLGMGQDSRVQAALSSMQTSASGSSVQLEFTLPVEFLDMARQFAPQLQPGPER